MRKKEKGYLTPFYINMSFLVLRRFPRDIKIQVIRVTQTLFYLVVQNVFLKQTQFLQVYLTIANQFYLYFKQRLPNLSLKKQYIEITGNLMKTFLIEIFIINFPQSNPKTWLLLKQKMINFRRTCATNHSSHVTKALRKAIMRRSYLENYI